MTHDIQRAIADLSYWINEREAIRERKEQGMKPPWSYDPLMANIRYCNVRREDDKVTRWIATNWRTPFADHPNLTGAMTLARLVNWPDTLAVIGFPEEWRPLRVRDVIRARASTGQKTWSSAYIVSTCGRSMDKEAYVVDHVCSQVFSRSWDWGRRGETLADAHKRLMQVDGLGNFLAAQVVADLKNTPGHPLQSAEDWWTWAAPGPGSLRGLNYFFKGEAHGSITAGQFYGKMRECWALVAPLLTHLRPMHMQDFQNCLCEFSKYMRAKQGNGHARNKYRAMP